MISRSSSTTIMLCPTSGGRRGRTSCAPCLFPRNVSLILIAQLVQLRAMYKLVDEAQEGDCIVFACALPP